MAVTPSDPRYYYLANFERALEWISQRYADLLSADEQAFLNHFLALPLAARALLVRMLMRRGELFRSSRLEYDEIGDPLAALAPLATLGWTDLEPVLPLDALFALLTKPELAEIFGSEISHSARKSDWLEQLAHAYAEPRTYAEWHRQCPSDRVAHIAIAPLCERLRLMFFGNLFQAWSEFVLADLGIFQYESVAFDAASRAFQRREDIDTYLLIHQCRAALELEPELDLAGLMTIADTTASDNPWLETRRAKLMFQIGQYSEKRQDWSHALAAYTKSAYPGARHRRIRVLERSERFDDAWRIALEALAAPESDEEHQRVSRMYTRLRRRVGVSGASGVSAGLAGLAGSGATGASNTLEPCGSEPTMTTPGLGRGTEPSNEAAADAGTVTLSTATLARIDRADITLTRPTDGTRVEWAALEHLTHEDAPVFYVENTLINALFGLLCWPAVFEAVPGAFFHPFQAGPADLHAPDFHARRVASFEACFAELETGTYRATIIARFQQKQGFQSPFVAWPAITHDLLMLALDCIPALHLKRCFERVLSNIKANRSGLPDLVRFWPAERRYTFIEIKGPGDRLQDNQLRWIDYCTTHAIPIQVLHVHWLDEHVGLSLEGTA